MSGRAWAIIVVGSVVASLIFGWQKAKYKAQSDKLQREFEEQMSKFAENVF